MKYTGLIILTLAFSASAYAQTDAELIEKYGAVAGESPGWTGRAELQVATLENEDLLEGSQAVIAEQAARLLPKYFSQYISG